jgi:hypothetical protein
MREVRGGMREYAEGVGKQAKGWIEEQRERERERDAQEHPSTRDRVNDAAWRTAMHERPTVAAPPPLPHSLRVTRRAAKILRRGARSSGRGEILRRGGGGALRGASAVRHVLSSAATLRRCPRRRKRRRSAPSRAAAIAGARERTRRRRVWRGRPLPPVVALAAALTSLSPLAHHRSLAEGVSRRCCRLRTRASERSMKWHVASGLVRAGSGSLRARASA